MRLTREDIDHSSKVGESVWIPCGLEVIQVHRPDVNALIDALMFHAMQIDATYNVDEVHK